MSRKAICAVLALVLLLGVMPARTLAWITEDSFTPCTRVRGVVTDSQVELHRVVRGETLWTIARNHGVDVGTLMAMNNLTGREVLLEGQLLEVPYRHSRVHKVRAGETLWEIARMYDVSVSDLASANDIRKPELLKIGCVLHIPSSASGPLPRGNQSSRGWITAPLKWPLVGTITSRFGWRRSGFHHGVDIAASLGSPIRAAASGTVVFTGYKPVYGRTVIIRHANGKRTLYGHAQKIKVKNGQKISRGQVIATVGNSGRSTGPHLHFEVHQNDKPQNPLNYLR
ncbi:MAG: M23 family metallopeptidase [Syntrophomonadaceae bacterium]|nr:M23 family metallopeptidase [Syntrophomonadaceae bacterium]